MNSILKTGLIAGGRESEERRQAAFLHTIKTKGRRGRRRLRQRLIEAENSALLVQVKFLSGRCLLDQLGQGTRKGTAVLADNVSRHYIIHNSVPADCIEKVVRQKGDNTFYERLSTPRHTPKIVPKSAWKLSLQ